MLTDFIVVGGGSAGCVAAARLSEDARVRVTLLERGPDPRPDDDLIWNPANALRIRASAFVDRHSASRANASAYDVLLGAALGGGSSVNMLSVTRPWPTDFEAWRSEAWTWEAVLPAFRRIENSIDHAGDPLHGSGGPMQVQEIRSQRPLSKLEEALAAGGQELGLPMCPDINGVAPFGVCPTVLNVKHGRRHSALAAYLDPVRSRPNLEIVCNATVTRLQVEGSRVVGVEYVSGGRAATLEAGQVVLCAGALRTPWLLLQSGIGPADMLRRHGLPVTLDRPGVGANYQDHATVSLEFEARGGGEFPGQMPAFTLVANSNPRLPHPDLHIIVRPPTTTQGGSVSRITIHLLEHRSRGTAGLCESRPAGPLTLVPRLLDEEADVQALVAGMELASWLVRTSAMRDFYGARASPGVGADLATFVRDQVQSYHHACGTCRLGAADDSMSVVDSRLRVHGLDNLRIADTSVVPVIPHAQMNLAAMMIGERVSQFAMERP